MDPTAETGKRFPVAGGAELLIAAIRQMAYDLIMSAKPATLQPLIQDLLNWRAAAGLSQSQAVAALRTAGLSVTLDSLQNWEIGRRKPNGETALALHAFLRGDA